MSETHGFGDAVPRDEIPIAATSGVGYFSLKTQFENVGDALINRELVKLVSKNIPVHVDVSRCPIEFKKTLGLNGDPNIFIENSSLKVLACAIGTALSGKRSYYFLSPGGYFGEKKGIPLVTAWLNTAVIWLLKSFGVRVCHIAVSYERIGPKHGEILRARSRLLYAHFARDEASASYARDLRLQVDGVIPDLAFGAASPLPQKENERTFIAISFRTDQDAQQASQVESLVRHLDKVLPSGIPFKLVSQVKRDEIFLKNLEDIVRRRECLFVDVSNNIEECKASYLNCSHVISNRLHALIVGSLSGAIPIGTVDRHANTKIIGLFDTLGVNGNVFDLNAENHENIAAAVVAGDTRRIDTLREKSRLENMLRGIFSRDVN